MSIKYIIILILACLSTLLLTSLEFSSVKNKIKNYLIISIFICIIISTMFSFLIYKEETIEKGNLQQIENARFENNVNKLDSITKIINLEYLKLSFQEEINNLHHKENIAKLYHLTDGLKQIVDEVKIQSMTEQEFFEQNFDSLSNVTKNLNNIARKTEIESYPLVPIAFDIKIHIKYNTPPFGNSSRWGKNKAWSEWFTFYNLSDSIDYGQLGFPEFEDSYIAIRDFIRNFKLSVGVKRDTINCFTYPKLQGITLKPRHGTVYLLSNGYDDYVITVYHSDIEHEFIFNIRTKIYSLYDGINICNYQSISDFEDLVIDINYEIRNPFFNKIFVSKIESVDTSIITYNNTKPKRVKGKEFIAMREQILKDTNFKPNGEIKKIFIEQAKTEVLSTLVSKKFRSEFVLDACEIYFDSVINISYGKNLSINRKLSLIENGTTIFDEYSWYCNGKYLFK